MWLRRRRAEPPAEPPVEPVKATVLVFAGQAVHAAAPVVALKVSAEQAVGVLPSGPVKPALATHAETAEEPAGLVLFTGQLPEHAVAASVPALNLPASQFSHVVPLRFLPSPHCLTQGGTPFGPVKVLSHVQAVLALEPAGLLLLSGQSVHAAAPVVALKVSAAHAVGVLPSGPVKPASATQVVEPVKATVLVFAGQAVHAAAPEVALKVSAAQAVGVLPSGPVKPASATQAVLTVEPVEPRVPVLLGQAVHAAAPVSALNVSAKQASI
jgi:hypothetical protein